MIDHAEYLVVIVTMAQKILQVGSAALSKAMINLVKQ